MKILILFLVLSGFPEGGWQIISGERVPSKVGIRGTNLRISYDSGELRAMQIEFYFIVHEWLKDEHSPKISFAWDGGATRSIMSICPSGSINVHQYTDNGHKRLAQVRYRLPLRQPVRVRAIVTPFELKAIVSSKTLIVECESGGPGMVELVGDGVDCTFLHVKVEEHKETKRKR